METSLNRLHVLDKSKSDLWHPDCNHRIFSASVWFILSVWFIQSAVCLIKSKGQKGLKPTMLQCQPAFSTHVGLVRPEALKRHLFASIWLRLQLWVWIIKSDSDSLFEMKYISDPGLRRVWIPIKCGETTYYSPVNFVFFLHLTELTNR